MRARAAVWSRFAAYCRQSDARLTDVAALQRWAHTLLREVTTETAARYVSHVVVFNERVFGPVQGPDAARLSDLRASLARAGAGRVVKQAEAATAADVVRIWRDASPEVGLMAAVMWAAALRHADAVGVAATDVVFADDRTVEITLRRTKTTAFGGPPRVVALVLPTQVRRALRVLIRMRGTRPLFNVPYRAFLKEVQKVRPGLTAHSFRRGAVQAALRSGATDEAVMRLTGHKSLESLATYAGRLPNTWRDQMVSASRATMWQP